MHGSCFLTVKLSWSLWMHIVKYTSELFQFFCLFPIYRFCDFYYSCFLITDLRVEKMEIMWFVWNELLLSQSFFLNMEWVCSDEASHRDTTIINSIVMKHHHWNFKQNEILLRLNKWKNLRNHSGCNIGRRSFQVIMWP